MKPNERTFLRLLGVPRAEHQGRELRFPDRKCVALLAVLALEGACTRARMATLLWDEQSDADARRNLRRELHRLRDAGFDALLSSDSDSLSLLPAVDVDAVRFRAALEGGQPAAAVQLHGARLLEGFDLAGAPDFHEWLAVQRQSLAQAWRLAADKQVVALQAANDLRGALALANRLVHDDTLQEAHYRRAMALHAALGEREDALALYERCRLLLGRELGLKPLQQTVDLADHIRRGSFTAAPAAETPPLAPPPVPALQTLPTAPLVGREGLLGALGQRIGQHRLTVLRGEAGVGKSRLLQALAARHPGTQLHVARVSDRRVPFASLVRWLRSRPLAAGLPAWVSAELARLLPECGAPPPPITADAQRLRLFEALRQAWAHSFAGTTLHVFDDWQFVDESSALWWSWWLGQGSAFAQAPGGVPVLVAERPGQASEETATVLRDALQAEGSTALEVQPLDEAAMLELVQVLSGTTRPLRFAQRLWQATGGHALYALETLQHLLQTDVVRVDESGQWHTPFDDATSDYHELPIAPSVQAAVLQRVQTLDDASRRLLEAASLIGDDFTLPLLAAASALGEWDAVQALESALQARVLVRHESQDGVYRFVHDLFAQAVAAALSPERRRLMHRAIGQRLAQDAAAPARVAEHFELGGDAQQALSWRLRALSGARARGALNDILLQADKVLALSPAGEPAVRAQMGRSAALLARAQGADAMAALEAAQAALRPEHVLDLHVDLACMRASQLLQGQGNEQTVMALDELLANPALSPHQRGRLQGRRSGALRVLGQLAEAELSLDLALEAFGDEPSLELGNLLDVRSRNAMSRGDFKAVLEHARRAVDVMHRAGHPASAVAPQTMCGVALMSMGQLDEALAQLQPARALAHQHGLVSAERGAILNMVAVLLAQGQAHEALQCLEQGFALSPHFRGPGEEQAFLEARYQCRVVVGELGAALDLRPELVARSRRIEEVARRHSGLLVATDLPLLIGHPELVAADLASVLHDLTALGAGYLAPQALAKAAWMALEQDQGQLALQHSSAAMVLHCEGPEQHALRSAFHAAALATQGRRDEARAALQIDAQGAGAEVAALVLAVGLRVFADGGDVPAPWQAQAQAAAQDPQVPLINRLHLLDALAATADAGASAGGPDWHRIGAPVARQLHASLASHADCRAHFERRYRRWLGATVAAAQD
jgi:DNA-binding SARP family transcriptional activator